jgi:hypothetical protein
MPIRWSALRVSEAMDMLDDYDTQATEPLEKARIVAREARNIRNLPQYVDQHLLRIISEIDVLIGGGQWQTKGKLKSEIESVREALPDDAVKDEKEMLQSGEQLTLAG